MVAPTRADYVAERKRLPPFADDDPALLLNIDFRNRAAAEATLTANSASLSGTGHLWDSERGFNPNRVSGYTLTNWVPVGHASRAAAFASGECTVFIELERTAIASSWLDDGAFFTDSGHGPSLECWDGSTVTAANHPYGDYTAAKFGHPFRVNANAGTRNLSCMYQVTASVGKPVGRLVLSSRDNNGDSPITLRARGIVPDLDCFDPDFMQLAYAIVGTKVHIYIDGHLIRVRALTEGDFVTLDMFYHMIIGSQGGTTNSFIGYIRRFQVANQAASMVREGPRIAFIHDSFGQRGAGHATPNSANPAAATVAQIDAVQNGFYESSLVTTSVSTSNTIIGAHWRPWIHELARVSANYGLPFQFYCAGNSGRGWATTGATVALVPYYQAFIDAVVAYDPEIIVATGSLNDVHGTNTATSYLVDTKAKIDDLIQGSHNVREFYFFETWPGYKGSSSHAVQSYINEYHRQRGLQAELDGYTVANASGIDVAVKFVPVYEKIGGDAHSANYTEGGSQYAVLWDAVFTKTKTMNDLHPGQVGMGMMVKVYWDALKRAILELPTL